MEIDFAQLSPISFGGFPKVPINFITASKTKKFSLKLSHKKIITASAPLESVYIAWRQFFASSASGQRSNKWGLCFVPFCFPSPPDVQWFSPRFHLCFFSWFKLGFIVGSSAIISLTCTSPTSLLVCFPNMCH